MIHLAHMLQRRYPRHALAVPSALVAASLLRVVAGLWTLAR